MSLIKSKALQIHPADDLIVALVNLTEGEQVCVKGVNYRVTENIQAKHKFAARAFSCGEHLTQYGIRVAQALCDIPAGAAIDVNNVKHSAQSFAVNNTQYQWQAPDVSELQTRSFKGVCRADGQVGTANYWLVVPLVFCQNRNVEMMRRALQDALGYSKEAHYIDYARNLVSAYRNGDAVAQSAVVEADDKVFPNVDGVKFITHTAGCGGTREDALALCKLLAAQT